MKLQLVPARQGAMWVRQGFAVFLRQPMGFAGLFAAFLFAVFVLAWVPFVGPVLLLFALLANLLFGLFGRIQLVPFVAMPASMIFSTIFYASLYFTFAACFTPEAGDDTPAEPVPAP
jgi:hypothetical protein